MDIEADKIGLVVKENHGTIKQFIETTAHKSLPNSIPSPQSFVGREEYLKELREAYGKGSRSFVLSGTGGVGKTALALQFAKEIAGEYQAKVFVEMQGMSKTPLSARDAMFDIVRQFEREISAEISKAQLKQLFVQFVQNQSTLIVLDNAANLESVEILQQAAACFIITSREAFALTSGESLKISQMSPEDARQLLFATCRNEKRFEGRADELAELAGYLPMALKPLASILKEDELETVADLIERYRDKKELLKERVPDYENLTVEASFELSYEKLSDEMKERWRCLSVFPADFDEAAIAAVLKVSIGKAKSVQKQLRRFSLLELNTENRRYSMHDIIRVFISEKLSENDRLQALFRYSLHYGSILLLTNESKDGDISSRFTNTLKLIDMEWSNFIVGQEWAADNIKSSGQIAKLCCDYAIVHLFRFRLLPREYINWQLSGLDAANRINNKGLEGTFLQNIGNTYKILGDYQKSIDYHLQSLTVARNLNHRQGEGQCLGNLGSVYKSLGQYRKAIEYYEQSLVISREIHNYQNEALTIGNLGEAYRYLGDFHKAIIYQEQALKARLEIKDLAGEGASLSCLGNIYEDMGDSHRAINYHERSLVISKEIGDLVQESKDLGNLGSAYQSLGEYQKAIDLHKQSLTISHKISNREDECICLGNIGTAYGNLDMHNKAIDCFEQCLKISSEIGDKLSKGASLTNLGTTYKRLHENEKACHFWKEALAIFEAIESPNANVVRQLIETNGC